MPRTRAIDPQIAHARAKIAASRRWAGTTREQRLAGTAKARAAADDRWLKMAAEQYPELAGEDLVRTADQLRREHYARLQLASIRARKAGRT